MKNIIVSLLSAAVISLIACNSSSSGKKNIDHDMTRLENSHATASTVEGIKEVPVTYTNVDPNAATVIRETISDYLHIQDALAGDNAAEAANAAKALLASLGKLDKSFLSASQKLEYDQLESHLKEHAKQIETSAGDISSQRNQFTLLSEKAYEMVKAFGAGKPVYQVHCPMAMDNEGANWLSDSREIKNPYFGKNMLTCGSITEAIQ
jgi:hypothetical protein